MIIAAAIAGTAAVAGAAITSGATKKASDASTHAADAATAVQKQIYDQQRADQQRFMQLGYAGANALTNRLRLPTQGVNSNGGMPAYGDNGMPPAPGSQARTSVIGAQGMGGYGANALTQPAGGGPASTTYTDDFVPKGGAQVNYGEQPQTAPMAGGAGPAVDPGTYGSTANPVYNDPGPYQAPAAYQAPDPFSFSVDDFTKNPAFQFAMSQGSGQVLANAGATGALHSGAALKRLQDRGQQTAYQFYAPERDFAYKQYGDNRNFGYGRYVDDRNFGRASYDTDRAFNLGQYDDTRNYLTNRFDQGTNDLFRVTGIGTGAAGASGAAGQNFANAQTGIVQANAANQGNAAIAGANSMNALLGSGVNALAYMNGGGFGTRPAALPKQYDI
jgi:hypothetical protein